MTVQALALPVMPFDKFYNYVPNWIEWITSLAPFAFMAILLSLSYRYLPIFPQEKELNP
jgi:molybdopterin-containing oxidoreductase family membrane subunit